MILGGAQENVIDTCDGLRRRHGWDARIVTGPAIGPEGELLSAARDRGIPCTIIAPMRRAINPWRDAASFAALVGKLRRLRPAIVHTHSSKAGLLGRLAAHVARVPLIIHHIRGLPFHPYESPAANAAFIAAERLAARVTDRFACVGQAMIDGAVGARVAPRSRFTLMRSGMDVDSYAGAADRRESVRRRFGLAPGDVVIGKIGRLFHLKGHRFVIQAAPRVIARCQAAKFLFIGAGILEERLAAMAAELGVRDRIVFAGLVPPAEIPAMISAMDLVVHTSLREGLARVLVQALLCQKPVVTFDLDGASEVIHDGVTGRLVPAESVTGLADALIRTIERPAEARRMAEAGRRRVTEEFDIRRTTRQTDRFYRRLLAEKGIVAAGT